jgi:hypothetical protein
MRWIRGVGFRVACVLVMPVLLGGCCQEVNLSLGRLSGFLSAALDLSLRIDLDLLISTRLTVDIGVRAGVRSVSNADLRIEAGEFDFLKGEVREDIDQDGSVETVHVLAAVDGADPDTHRIFLYWKGDEYTLDGDRCYLAWVWGKKVRLASAPCDDSSGATLCRMRVADERGFVCEACTGSGDCVRCDTGDELDDCRVGADADAGGAPIDADIEPDAGVDAGVDAGADAGVDAGEDGAVTVELSACEKQVVELAREADDCGMDVFLDEQDLCRNSSAEVGVCYAAYEAADLLGQNTCAVLRDQIVCGVVVNQGDPGTNCEKRVEELVEAGDACGMNLQLDAAALCADGAARIDACFAAYDAARLTGQDICAVLRDAIVCPDLS